MIRKLLFWTVAFMLIPAALASAQNIRVAVVPFSIYSQEDLGYLSQGVQGMLNDQLQTQGFEIVPPSEVSAALGAGAKPANMDEASARNLGRKVKADYVIFGSLTKLGNRVSLDSRLVQTPGTRKTSTVFVQQEGLENLTTAARQMADEIAVRFEGGGQRIADIKIQGNKRIENDAIMRIIRSQKGGRYSRSEVSEDLKRIYDMGYFDDVKIDVSDTADGKVVTFIVDERPAIAEITFKGNRRIETDELTGALGFGMFSILDTKKLAESIQKLKALYREKGYYNADIQYETAPLDQNRVALTYQINESSRLYVKRIDFVGNKAYSDGKLEDQMDSGTKSMFSWFTDAGILKRDVLENDIQKVQNFYFNHGYIKSRVGDPDIQVKEDGIYISIPVDEGPQYRISDIQVTGDLIIPEKDIRKKLVMRKGDVYNREKLIEDVRTITTMFADKGYAYANVKPDIAENNAENTVSLDYSIDKGQLVSFERISIAGNDKTKDKVIRRELAIKEGEQFSAEGMRKSSMSLQHLGYFEDVQFVTSKGSADDKMDVKIEVKEQPTGQFSIGAGYGSDSGLFGMAKISQNNLFGTGRQLSVQGTIGGNATDYSVSFTEPWLFDIPLSAGFDIYDRTFDYDDYDKSSVGFNLRAGYPIWRKYNVRLSGRYQYEQNNVSAVSANAAQSIRDAEGDSTTSSILAQLRRDSRDKLFSTTSGSDNSILVERAGGFLGGTNHFTRYVVDSGWFIPTFLKDVTLFVRGKAGVVTEDQPNGLPVYEKFYLGGINSVRGFKWGQISPLDPVTGEKIGGEYMGLFNVELSFPLIKDAGFMGVVFYDQGNVWTKDDGFQFGDMKKSYGGGIRYFSPLGPLRLEYGRVISPKDGEPTGNWEFTVGTFF